MPKRVPSILRRKPESRATPGFSSQGLPFITTPTGGMLNLAGVAVTPQTALNFLAVYAAINVLATDSAAPPMRLYRRRKGGGRDLVEDRSICPLLMFSPDGETGPLRWRQAIMSHVLSWGNAYAEIERDGNGDPLSLSILEPQSTEPARSKRSNKLFYKLDSGRNIPAYNVIHLAGLGYNGLVGFSPIGIARQAIGLGIAAESYGAAFFGNGSTPKGVLKTPQKLTKEAAERLRGNWEAMHQGVQNAHGLAILEQGLEWQGITIPPEDAQFLATRAFQVLEIARLYRLPPSKLGDFQHAHLANIEISNIDYLTTSLMPWFEMIEQEMCLKLLTAKDRSDGYYIEHTMAAFLRGDMKSRADFYRQMWQLGTLSPDEIRALENLNPIGPEKGGDQYFIQGAFIPLDKAGEEPVNPGGSPNGLDDGQDDSEPGDGGGSGDTGSIDGPASD